METARGFTTRKAGWRSAFLVGLALAALSGSAQAATHVLTVKVTDEKGRALPMATVEARVGRGAPVKVRADAGGQARMRLKAGTYQLLAMATAHAPKRMANVRVPRQKSVTIAMRSFLKPGKGAIVWHALGADGKPLIGAVFQLVGPGGVIQRSTYNQDPYGLEDIPAGTYRYAAYARGHQQQRGSVTVPQGLTSKVLRLARVRPARSCRATLNFFDGATGKPLNGVSLTYGYQTKFRKSVTANRSTTVGPFKPGAYWAEAWKQGYKKTKPTLNLEAASMSRDVYLTPEANRNVFIYLTCKDAQTNAAVRTQVTITGPGVNKKAWTSGNHSLFGSGREGKWLVTAQADGYQPYRQELNVVKRGSGVQLNIRLNKVVASVPAGAKKFYATFVFTDARSKAPLSGVTYTASGPGTNTRNRANRSVRVGPLAGGMHLFTFERPGYQKVELRSRVSSSGSLPVAMVKLGESIAVAPAKNYLSITATPSTGGLPIAGARVVVQGPSGRKVKVLSQKDIAAVFYDLAPGTYSYTVTAAGYGAINGRIKMGSASRETRTLKMKPGALTVSVLVVDEKNAPVSGATVQAMGPGGKGEKTSANSAGQARLKLFTGVWGVTASARGFQGVSQRLTVPVKTVPRFTLKFVRGGLGFTVMSAAGVRPVAGARVAVSGARGKFSGTTDARGVYILKNVPQGSYSYTVTAPGYVSGAGRYSLKSTGTMAISVKLRPSSSDLTITVLDAKTRKPVSGVSISARVGSGYERKVTDAAGRVKLPGLKVSSCLVYASKTGYAQARGTWRSSQGANLTLMLPRPPLGVKVLDSAGKPIPDASVTAYWFSRSGFMRRAKSRNATVKTGANGQAWVPVTRTTAVKSVVVKVAGYKSAGRSSVRLPAQLELRLEKIIPPSQRKAALTVKVLDSSTRRPLPGAAVRIEAGAKRHNLTVSPAGVAVFKDLPWGRWRVYASKAGYGSWSSSATLDESGDKSVVLQLTKRTPRFVFTVLDSAGKPVSGATLSLSWREQGTRTYRYKYDRGESDAKGQVLLYQATTRDLRALITVVKSGLPTTKRYLGRVSGNSPYRQAVRFGPAIGTVGTLTLTVSDYKTGAKIVGARIVGTAAGKTYAAESVRGTGAAVIRNLPLNTKYVYTVTRPGYATLNTSALLKGNAKIGIRLKPAVVSLSLTVYGTARRPIPGATVAVFWGNPRGGKPLSRRAVTGRDGRAAFSDTPSNQYLSLSVSARGYKPKTQQLNPGTKNAAVQLSR